MKDDVIKWSRGESTGKMISKETINHPGLIELATGRDVFGDTPEAYREAYRRLGIDLINRVPLSNAPAPCPAGEIAPGPRPGTMRQALGVYDSIVHSRYACETVEKLWDLDLSKILVDWPPPADQLRRESEYLGDFGVSYHLWYTTLFMAPVELLGWEIFMTAAMSEPDRFHDFFLLPCVQHTKQAVRHLAASSDSPFVFLHDDLASASGPVFPPGWYDDYIFPHYPEIFAEARRFGKKIIFVSDGNMSVFLPRLAQLGVDGLMCENPATPLEAALEYFGRGGRFLIGGIETATLTFGSCESIKAMVHRVAKMTADTPGFALASGGGLHGNIPLPNLIAYFDARAEIGATPPNWRNSQ